MMHSKIVLAFAARLTQASFVIKIISKAPRKKIASAVNWPLRRSATDVTAN
jgi:hypothetical protein